MWEWRTIARSPALSSGDMADGEEIQCLVEVSLGELEVRSRDGRGEAVIEGLRQAEALVERIPAELDRDLVGTKLAGVMETEQLDLGEVTLAERAELGGAVLLDVPGVV